jgi:Protein of unknown function (DUF2800)
VRHHPQGPSRQKNLEPSVGGCEGFLPNQQTQHENKLLGSICHEIWDTGRRELANRLPDPEFALELVDRISQRWEDVEQEFSRKYGLPDVSQNECFLTFPGINFGTSDRVRVSARAALIGDGKFGAWKVEHAQHNLQGHNYAALVWEMYPEVEDIWVWFGNPRLEDYTLGKFTRSRDYQKLKDGLCRRIYNAQHPDPERFCYDELNCSFCARWDCPVRLSVAASAIEGLKRVAAENMTNEKLAQIKTAINPLKTLLKGVDEEAKQRVTLDGELLPGFEQKEKVHRRDVIGLPNVNVLRTYLGAHKLYGISQRVDELLSISWSDIEQLILHAFEGDNKKAKPIISEIQQELRDSGALTETKYYTVVAINDESQLEK